MGVFRFVSFTLPALAVVLFCLHYLIFGPRRAKPAQETRFIPRMSLLERLVHAVTIVSLLVLAGTGWLAAIGIGPALHGWYLIAHCTAGSFFTLSLVITAFLWADACCFEAHDGRWLRGSGGYLLGKECLPAGRFDGGQKLMFWVMLVLGLAVLVTATLPFLKWFGTDGQSLLLRCHRYSGLLLILVTIKHVYLVAVAKPAGLRAMTVGTVSAEWATRYHPLWLVAGASRPCQPDGENGEPKQ